jgi:hypothetical protein
LCEGEGGGGPGSGGGGSAQKDPSLIKPNSRRIIWQNIFTVVLGEAEMLELFAWHGVGLVGRKGSTSMMCFASRENAKKSI